MWREVANKLVSDFTLVCADLRGYGRSGCPVSTPDHFPYSKRSMALDMVQVMDHLGFSRFFVAGHDRGARVAYRLALDHPTVVKGLAVLDIVPTAEVWDEADSRFALAFWPWTLLAQDEPLPERILTELADVIVEQALKGWGSAATAVSKDVREAYAESLRDEAHAHAICEEYRAAATIDREHDIADLANERRIICPTLVLWSGGGPLDKWYKEVGGPLSIWRNRATDILGFPVSGGHFFPEAEPLKTADILAEFFRPIS